MKTQELTIEEQIYIEGGLVELPWWFIFDIFREKLPIYL